VKQQGFLVGEGRPMIGLRGFGSHCYSSCPGSGGAAELTGMDGNCSRHLAGEPCCDANRDGNRAEI
jgi:hypothetical protein